MANRDKHLEKMLDVSIENVKDSNIEVTVNVQQGLLSPVQDVLRPSVLEPLRLDDEHAVSSMFESEQYLIEKLEQTVDIVSQTHAEPIIRVWALYSGFCSLWEKSNLNDLPQMELMEKEQMRNLVNLGCDFRVLLNLDIWTAKSVGFSKEEVLKRIADLCEVCDSFVDRKNFKLAIDDSCANSRGVIIFDTALACHQLNFQNRANYSMRRWHSNENDIQTSISDFDRFFLKASTDNKKLMKRSSLTRYSELIHFYTRERLQSIPDWSA